MRSFFSKADLVVHNFRRKNDLSFLPFFPLLFPPSLLPNKIKLNFKIGVTYLLKPASFEKPILRLLLVKIIKIKLK
jgi:hypothetical protein